MLDWVYDDGGRAAAGFKGEARDCVCRAISIAEGLDYATVYADLWELTRAARLRRATLDASKKKIGTPRTGMNRRVYGPYLEKLGWEWVPCAAIGSESRTRVSDMALLDGVFLIQVSKHMACMKDGVLHDTQDCSRGGKRMVYGYWGKNA